MHKRSRESHDTGTLRLPSYNYNNNDVSNNNSNSSSSTTSSEDNHLPFTPTSTNTSSLIGNTELEFTNTSSHSLSNYMETTASESSSSLISPSVTNRSASSSSSYLLASSHVSLRTISNSSASSSLSSSSVTPLSSHPPASSPFRKLRSNSLHTRSLSRSSSSLKASFTIPSIPLPSAIDYNTKTTTINSNNRSDNNSSKSGERNDSSTSKTNMPQNFCIEEKDIESQSRNKDHATSFCKDDTNGYGTTKITFVKEKNNEKFENSVETDIWSILFSVDNTHLEKEKIEYREKDEKDDTINETSNVDKFLESINKMEEHELAESTINNHLPIETNKVMFDESEKMTNDYIAIDVHEENVISSSSHEKEVEQEVGYNNSESNENITITSDHAEDMENINLRREENSNQDYKHIRADKTLQSTTNDISNINMVDINIDGISECARLETHNDNKELEENVNAVSLECHEHANTEMINEIEKHAEV